MLGPISVSMPCGNTVDCLQDACLRERERERETSSGRVNKMLWYMSKCILSIRTCDGMMVM